MFSRFDTIHACNGQTDRQTDGQTELAWHIRAIAYNAVARKNYRSYSCEVSFIFYTIMRHSSLGGLLPNSLIHCMAPAAIPYVPLQVRGHYKNSGCEFLFKADDYETCNVNVLLIFHRLCGSDSTVVTMTRAKSIRKWKIWSNVNLKPLKILKPK